MVFVLFSGPWPLKPQHLQELAAKEQQDGSTADKAAAAEAQAQKQRQQQAANRQSGAGGPAVVEQVLTLNNELFMVPEALFRSVLVLGGTQGFAGFGVLGLAFVQVLEPCTQTQLELLTPNPTSCRIQHSSVLACSGLLGQLFSAWVVCCLH